MGEERYQKLYQQSVTALLSADRTGRVVDCNTAACRLLSCARNELLGTPLLQWVAPRERRVARQRFVELLSGGELEWRSGVLRPGGGTRSVLVRGLMHEAGDRIDVFIRKDVSGPERSPDDALRAVLENMPGQFSLVLDGDARIRCARGLARTHWRNDAALIGADLASLLSASPESAEQLLGMRRAMAGGTSWSVRQQHQRADGSTFEVVLYAVPHPDGETGRCGAVVVGRDVSEETALRLRLERAERLAGIGGVVASIAHELRSPIEVLRGVLPLLLDAAAETGVFMQLDRIAELVGRLDAFASDRSPLVRSLSLRACVDDVVRRESPRIRDAGVHISNAVPADLPAVPADRRLVGRALQEVLANALDAAAVASDKEIRFEASADAERVVLRVHDSGAGIAAGRIERVMEPFYTTKPGRLGVGLALVHGIVAVHGGRISIKARAHGTGTTVVIELPLRQRQQPVPFRPVPLVLRSLTVLVVDDDAAVRSVICRVLERVGYRVREAFSGRSALAELATGELPDLVITDLRMKGGTGHWLLEKLGREYPRLVARTVIVIGDPSDGMIARVASETGCPVLRKPIEFSALLEVLDEVALRAAAAQLHSHETTQCENRGDE